MREALGQALRGIRAVAAAAARRGACRRGHGDGAAARWRPAGPRAVLAAKLAVAENLDALTAEDSLALFLLFGRRWSRSAIPARPPMSPPMRGWRRWRAAAAPPAGRPMVVGWGPIADAGMLAGDAGTAGSSHAGSAPRR